MYFFKVIFENRNDTTEKITKITDSLYIKDISKDLTNSRLSRLFVARKEFKTLPMIGVLYLFMINISETVIKLKINTKIQDKTFEIPPPQQIQHIE